MADPIGDLDFSAEEAVVNACVSHARKILESQMPIVENRSYDLMPSLKEMTIQVYLAGVMWRFGEQFELPTHPRDRGFVCLLAMLLSDGIPYKKAQQRIAHLNEISRTTDGKDILAITAGYNATEGDGSLAIVLDYLNTLPQASGAPSRLWTQAKPIAAILAGATFSVSTLLGYSLFSAIGIGVVIGITALGVTKIISDNMIKPKS